MLIGLVDIGIGNLGSLRSVLEKLNLNFRNCTENKDFENVEKILLPGVGNFAEFMEVLRSKSLDKTIIQKVNNRTPILGICLGYQILFEESDEGVKTKGLGLLKGKFKSLDRVSKTIKVPHVGWNECSFKKKNNLFNGIPDKSDFYFTHTYYLDEHDHSDIISETNYQINFTSAINKNNIYGVQFHPEKSQKNGLKLLENFFNNC